MVAAERARASAEDELEVAKRELAACDARRRRGDDDVETTRVVVERQRVDFGDAVLRARELESVNAQLATENEAVKVELVVLRKRVKATVRGAKAEAARAQEEWRDAEERAHAAEEVSADATGEADVLKQMVGALQIELRRVQQTSAQLRKKLKAAELQQVARGAHTHTSGPESRRPPTSATHVTDVSSIHRG